MQKIGFIGGGRITRIFLQALKNRNFSIDKMIISDPDKQALAKLIELYSGLNVAVGSNVDAAAQDVLFLAVHPPVFKEVLPEITNSVQQTRAVVSLAPVFTAGKLSALLNGYDKLVRMIPNAATIMNIGYNPVWFSETIGATEKNFLVKFFSMLGECPEVEEEKLEAYAILTAMGPTYLWPQFNELHKLSTEFGLSGEEAKSGIKAMVANTIDLIYDSGLSYDQVVDLIPVKPFGEHEDQIRELYRSKLKGLFNKLTGK